VTTTATITILALLSLGLHPGQIASPFQDDLAWLTENTQAELDRLLPIDEPAGYGVVFRSYQDLNYQTPERFFRIEFSYDSRPRALRAVFVAPLNGSIQQQLLDLHVANRTASIEDIRSRIKLSRVELREDRCPALERSIESLRRLRLSLPTNPDVIMIHPEIFRVVASFGDGQVDATLFDARHPLARWAVGAYDDLQECAKR